MFNIVLELQNFVYICATRGIRLQWGLSQNVALKMDK